MYQASIYELIYLWKQCTIDSACDKFTIAMTAFAVEDVYNHSLRPYWKMPPVSMTTRMLILKVLIRNGYDLIWKIQRPSLVQKTANNSNLRNEVTAHAARRSTFTYFAKTIKAPEDLQQENRSRVTINHGVYSGTHHASRMTFARTSLIRFCYPLLPDECNVS